jgi:hypothetical protein
MMIINKLIHQIKINKIKLLKIVKKLKKINNICRMKMILNGDYL